MLVVLLLVIEDVILFNVVSKLVKKAVELSNTVSIFVPLLVSKAVVTLVEVLNAVTRDTVAKLLTYTVLREVLVGLDVTCEVPKNVRISVPFERVVALEVNLSVSNIDTVKNAVTKRDVVDLLVL